VHGPAWHLYNPNDLVEIVNSVTGWGVSLWELMLLGRRRLNMLRAFNSREGVGRNADKIPEKLKKPLVGGPTEGEYLQEDLFEHALDIYYQMAGWDGYGNPTPDTLEEIGLEWIAGKL
jgi:aldehyde:ferredoxin oxidoreductase